MHRDDGHRRAMRMILMAVLLALVLTGVSFELTQAQALADWIWQ